MGWDGLIRHILRVAWVCSHIARECAIRQLIVEKLDRMGDSVGNGGCSGLGGCGFFCRRF